MHDINTNDRCTSAYLECFGVLIQNLMRIILKQRRCLARQKTGVAPLSQHISTSVITEDLSPAILPSVITHST